jgi:two-component system, cell cycle response regulator DivK
MATPVPPSSRLRVGVLDDNKTARLITCRMLRSGPYEPVPLVPDDDVVAAARTLDVLLLDISLGECDGRDIARELRQHSAIPLIAVTSFAGSELRESLLLAGFNDYLHKPFRAAELLSKVGGYTQRLQHGT